jgi:hypothetical protein
MKRRYGGPALALAVGAGVIVAAVLPRHAPSEQLAPQIDTSVPEHRLLEDALTIAADRQSGETEHFAYVPKTRPPDLLRMTSGGRGDAVTDIYQSGAQQLHTIVEFAAQPTGTCRLIEDGRTLAGSLCVHESRLAGPATTPPARTHVTVYLTGTVGAGPRSGDPDTDRATRFWSKTELIPLDRAAWFQELVARGRAAPRP